ncbi:hypothetical protein QJS66_19070 [Kocuria rhizophila]|nr:hypothetical protein QJS66_19070 [Kocuria rhizophila]
MHFWWRASPSTRSWTVVLRGDEPAEGSVLSWGSDDHHADPVLDALLVPARRSARSRGGGRSPASGSGCSTLRSSWSRCWGRSTCSCEPRAGLRKMEGTHAHPLPTWTASARAPVRGVVSQLERALSGEWPWCRHLRARARPRWCRPSWRTWFSRQRRHGTARGHGGCGWFSGRPRVNPATARGVVRCSAPPGGRPAAAARRLAALTERNRAASLGRSVRGERKTSRATRGVCDPRDPAAPPSAGPGNWPGPRPCWTQVHERGVELDLLAGDARGAAELRDDPRCSWRCPPRWRQSGSPPCWRGAPARRWMPVRPHAAVQWCRPQRLDERGATPLVPFPHGPHSGRRASQGRKPQAPGPPPAPGSLAWRPSCAASPTRVLELHGQLPARAGAVAGGGGPRAGGAPAHRGHHVPRESSLTVNSVRLVVTPAWPARPRPGRRARSRLVRSPRPRRQPSSAQGRAAGPGTVVRC